MRDSLRDREGPANHHIDLSENREISRTRTRLRRSQFRISSVHFKEFQDILYHIVGYLCTLNSNCRNYLVK